MIKELRPFHLLSRRLEVFRIVAEEGSITRAAARLALTQPAVTRELGLLEKEIGAPLFDRLPRGVQLNEAGRVLITYVQRCSGIADDARRALDEFMSLERGQITIAASNTIGNHFLPGVIVAFHRRHPRVTIDVRITNSREVLRFLEEDRVSLGFVETKGELPEGYEAHLLTSDEMIPVVAPFHPLTKIPRPRVRDLLVHLVLLREEGSGMRAAVLERFERLGVTPPDTLSLGTTEAIRQVLLAGVGISILPRRAVTDDLASGRLVALSIPKLVIHRELHWVKRTHRRLGRAHGVFLELLQGALGVMPPETFVSPPHTD